MIYPQELGDDLSPGARGGDTMNTPTLVRYFLALGIQPVTRHAGFQVPDMQVPEQKERKRFKCYP